MRKYSACERLWLRGETLSLFTLANKRIYSLHQHAEGLRYGTDSAQILTHKDCIRKDGTFYCPHLLETVNGVICGITFSLIFWDKSFWFYEHQLSDIKNSILVHKERSLKALSCKNNFWHLVPSLPFWAYFVNSDPIWTVMYSGMHPVPYGFGITLLFKSSGSVSFLFIYLAF